MAQLNYLTTVPRLYYHLTEEYSKETNNFVLKYKVAGKYVGITYDQLKEETDSFAFGLASLGIKKDDKIAIIAENRPEWVYSDFAILGLGAIDVPLYPSLTAESIEFILNNSESKAIIVSTKFQLNKVMKFRDKCKSLKFIILLNEKDFDDKNKDLMTFKKVQELGKGFKNEHPSLLKDNLDKIKPDEVCTIIYTSGTTGEPKGVVLTHHNILSNVQAALDCFPIGNTDVFLSFLPLCHIFERMAGYYTAFSAKCTVCYAESIETVAQNLIDVKPTIMTSVPRLFERIHSKIIKNVDSQPLKKQKIFYWAMDVGVRYAEYKKTGNIPFSFALKHKLADKLVFSKLREKTGGNLRFFISGGAALPLYLGKFFEAIGIIIVEGYGLTESSPVICANRVEDFKFGTVGKPFPGVEIKIASDGEILARGPNIMQGYYKNKKETDATIKDGWLYTGDIGVFDGDGFLMITDRKKHLFKTSAGKYIAPNPIESMFLASKYIDQFVLIGDRRMFLTALIVPDFEAVKEYADAHKIPYDKVEDLVRDEQIYKMLDKEMDQFQKKLANYEKVRKFVLLDRPFSIESGEITPSLKIKRKYVEERYQDLIEQMYQSLDRSVPIN
ncbi:MAG TPA: long-chain fatty acid--CoA ligase [Ignavibacteriales bacterium]|nr:long-chain fatty acid--CoA ligase [Ignavibacteriales bacterium]